MVPRSRRRENRTSPGPEAIPWQYHVDQFVCHASATGSPHATDSEGWLFQLEFACEAGILSCPVGAVFILYVACVFTTIHGENRRVVCKALQGEVHREKQKQIQVTSKSESFISLFVRVICMFTSTAKPTQNQAKPQIKL